MFDKLFIRKRDIDRYKTDPLLNERLMYLQHCHNNGTAKLTLCVIARYITIITDQLNLKNKKIISIKTIKTAAKRWSSKTNRHHKLKKSVINHKHSLFIWHATQWLRMLNRLQLPVKKEIPFEPQILQYLDYMRDQKGCSELSVTRRYNHLKHFVVYISSKINLLININILIVDNFFTKKININSYARGSIRAYACAIRAFLSYAEENGWCKRGIAKNIRVPKLYQDQDIPYGPSWNDVKKLIATTSKNNPKDIRDRAILLLLSVYGLRSGEVIRLCFNDIDWENNFILFKRTKNLKFQKFPLSPVVGNAIMRYIKTVRPKKCNIREVFLNTRAPYKSINTAALSTMIHIRWQQLNIKLKHYGAHSLRHACATHLINKGLSLKEISSHLGHRHLDSTRIYTKVDLAHLRLVANIDLGELL